MSSPAKPSDQSASAALVAVSALATLDIASFVWSRRKALFGQSPSRAGGSLLGLVLWSALLGTSVRLWRAPEEQSSRRWARRLAVTCGVGNLALAAVHLRIRKGVGRGLLGGGLGLAALAAAHFTDEPVDWGAPS